MLNEVGGGQSENGQQQGTEEGLGEQRAVSGEQAQEAAPGADRSSAGRRGGASGVGHHDEQVAGPAPAECVAGQLLDAASRIGDDDAALADLVNDDEMPKSLGGAGGGRWRQGGLGQGVVGSPGG